MERWRQLVVSLARAPHGILKHSKEPLTWDVVLKPREYAQTEIMFKKADSLWIMLDYFKTNRALHKQCKYHDIESLKWTGDDKLQPVYTIWMGYNDGDSHSVE